MTPALTVLLPFGAAQWLNGARTRAALFGAAQGIAASAYLGGFATMQGMLALIPDRDHTTGQQRVFNVAKGVHVAGGAALLGLYAVSVVEAWVHRQPEKRGPVSEKRRPLTSAELEALR